MPLPPGQQLLDHFPRFGTHLHRPPPAVPDEPAIGIGGAVTNAFALPIAGLASLPRRELTADFHCVAGWSAAGQHWEGVPFAALFAAVLEPALRPGATITHVVFGGIDGHQSVLEIEDALADDVLIADRLNGRPLGPDHGEPARLVSPRQYGYMSTKHLCEIELHTSKPTEELGAATRFSRLAMRGPLVVRHPRARVWEEERHAYLPARLLRPLYRLTVPVGIRMGRSSL